MIDITVFIDSDHWPTTNHDNKGMNGLYLWLMCLTPHYYHRNGKTHESRTQSTHYLIVDTDSDDDHAATTYG